MAKPMISAEGVGKKYIIGRAGPWESQLRHEVHNLAMAPFRWLRNRDFGFGRRRSEEYWALRDVSFEIQPGEVVGVIGRNGAGKSTLLKILARITPPTEGCIRLRGRVASLLEVGAGFHPELTGRENIFLNGAILGMSLAEIRRRFDEIVAFAEIEKFLATPVKRYSSGMYVRLAFAVAAHLEPEILIVDEVLAVGDAAFQKKCLGKVQSVAAQEGRTVLFVSHNMAAVAQLCKKAIWLHEGHVSRMGESQEVLRAYLEHGSQQVPQRRWAYPGDAPGDDRVRLRGARVLQHERVTGIIDINQPAQIEIEFQLLQSTANVFTGVALFGANGVCIFQSVDWREIQLSSGIYRKTVTLRPQLLAEGSFSVALHAGGSESELANPTVGEALAFEAIESDHPHTVRGHYKEPWPGVIRPRLTWSHPDSL